ncbi:LysR family transcriptional regulator [Acinetobacter courvalinii]|uniref:LysR family transcriptional regulator n=1 Tax=Acinetobacter courvalinii TaxID=280147 RepID=UPI003F552B54
MDIRDLKTFIYVVDHQSITIASEKLGVNQSTVTKRICNMEDILKGVLFNRKTRPLQLTSLGEKVYFKGCLIVKELEALANFRYQAEENERKKIKIGIPHTLADELIEHLAFEAKKTDVLTDIEISSGWGRSLIQQIQNEEIDLATFMIPSNLGIPPDLLFSKIGILEFVVVCKRGEAYKYSNFEKCSKKGWILHPEGCCFRESLSNLLYERNLGFYINREIFGLELQLQSILRGEGLGIFPKPFFDKFSLKNNGLERIELKDFPLHLNVGIVKSQSMDNEKARSFLEIVKKRYF